MFDSFPDPKRSPGVYPPCWPARYSDPQRIPERHPSSRKKRRGRIPRLRNPAFRGRSVSQYEPPNNSDHSPPMVQGISSRVVRTPSGEKFGGPFEEWALFQGFGEFAGVLRGQEGAICSNRQIGPLRIMDLLILGKLGPRHPRPRR
jgi:hypothetical protein